MDAKPLRGFRVADENEVPSLAPKKTIHSRNKSSPALSTLAAKGAFKMAPKRAVMGDVSNARGNRPAQEEFVNYKNQPEKKKVALLQPAQRPLSMISGPNGSQPLASIKQNSEKFLGESGVPSVRQVISKRATTIFKDYSTADAQNLYSTSTHVPPAEAVTKKQVLVSGGENLQFQAPAAHTKTKAPNSKSSEAYYESMVDQENLLRTTSVMPRPSKSQAHPSEASSRSIGLSEVVNSSKNSIAAVENAESHRLVDVKHLSKTDALNTISNKSIPIGHVVDSFPIVESYHVVETRADLLRERVSDHLGLDTRWRFEEDEEDDYCYDGDDAYVTARSFRGVNDITNVTTTIIPRKDTKARHEVEAAAAVVSLLKSSTDLEDEAWDVTMVSEYREEIFQYYREMEIKLSPNPHYMEKQTEIQWSMRAVLMDWVVQVHGRFQLLPETLYLAANLIDRFLSCKVVSMNKLQLVGATALFIAAKYEEVNCPSVGEMVFMVDKGYSPDELLKAERFMLTLLQFDLGWPGPMSFLRRISTADDYDLETRTVAKYLLELTIMDERFLGCPPSFTAAAAHCLARLFLMKGHWTYAHVHYSGYTYVQLYPLLLLIVECLEDPTRHHFAIYEKYLDKRFKAASHFIFEEMRRGFQAMDPLTNGRGLLDFRRPELFSI